MSRPDRRRKADVNQTGAQQLQFSVSFLPLEDRLLLRGSFPDGTEIQVLLTRRLTKGMLRLGEQVATRLVKGDIPDPATQAKVVEFTREAAVQQADFSQSYKTGSPHPSMAAGARLISALSITPQPGDRLAIAFTLDKGEKLSFTLGNDHLWGLIDLIARQAAQAEWDLAPTPGKATPDQAPRGPVN